MKSDEADQQAGPAALLLGMATSLGGVGTFRWELAADDLRLSGRARQILGIHEDGTPTAKHVIEAVVHPDDRDRAFDLRARTRATAARVPAGEWLLQEPLGGTRRVTMAMVPAFHGRHATEMLGSLVDVTERRDRLRERQVFLTAFQTLDEGTADRATELIAGMVRALDWESGTLWTDNGAGGAACRAHWSRSGADPPSAPRRGHGGRDIVTVPVRGGGRMIGWLELAPAGAVAPNPALAQAVRASAAALGAFLARNPPPGPSPLTARETEVIQLASNGGSSAAIADRLTVSISTVKTHFENIYAKLGVTDRAAAVAEAMRQGAIR